MDFKRHCRILLHEFLQDKNDTSFNEHLAALSIDISEIIVSIFFNKKRRINLSSNVA